MSPEHGALDTAEQRELEDLKIAMLSRGVRMDADTLARLGGAQNITAHEYATTGGIPFRMGDIYVNAAFDEWYCDSSTVTFGYDDSPHLVFAGKRFEIDEVYPLPGYLGCENDRGVRIDDIAFSHLDRVRLSPIVGCAYDCAFCDLPGRINLRPLADIQSAAEVALADERLPPRHLLISGGSPGPRQWPEFTDTLVALVRSLSPRLPVDVMMSSGPGTVELVHRLVDAGAHGFALNIEVESSDAATVHIKGKHRRARPHFDATVSAAVDRLGSTGRVRSLILPGLEPVEETLNGVEHIASLGADPVLSPFRPAQGTQLVDAEPVSAEALRLVLDGSRSIASRHGVRLGPRCLPCQHNTLGFPWDVAA